MTGEVIKVPYLEAYLASSTSSSGLVSSRGRAGSRYYVNESSSACWACAGNHDSFSCDRKRCFKCAEPGHESKDCDSKPFCQTCSYFGHSNASECPRSQYLAGLDVRVQSSVTCMRCGELGHMCCKPQRQDQRPDSRSAPYPRHEASSSRQSRPYYRRPN